MTLFLPEKSGMSGWESKDGNPQANSILAKWARKQLTERAEETLGRSLLEDEKRSGHHVVRLLEREIREQVASFL